jgi:hypothetical protein
MSLKNSLVRVSHIGALIAIPAQSHLANRDLKRVASERNARKDSVFKRHNVSRIRLCGFSQG